MTTALYNAMKWNYDKATALYRQSAFVNNHDRQQAMLKDYTRLARNGDHCRREVWKAEHSRKHA